MGDEQPDRDGRRTADAVDADGDAGGGEDLADGDDLGDGDDLADEDGPAGGGHVLPDEVEYPDRGGEPGSGLPPRVENWRRRSATGAMLTGFAFGLRDVLEPERRAPAIVLETSGVPPKDLPVEADLDNVPPRQSVVRIRRWLLTDGPETGADGPAAGEAVTDGEAVTEGEPTDGAVTEGRVTEGRVTEGRVTEIRRRETTRKSRFKRRGGKR